MNKQDTAKPQTKWKCLEEHPFYKKSPVNTQVGEGGELGGRGAGEGSLQPVENTTVKQVSPAAHGGLHTAADALKESAVHSEPSVGQDHWQEL